jgi:Zn-dependent M16 (insulinase) family peptidase
MENIVIIALLLGAIVGLVKITLDFLKGLAEIRKETAVAIDHKISERFEALHAEIAELRETALQHEDSLQQLLDNVDQRVANVETHNHATHVATEPLSDDQSVIAGRRVE